MAPQTLTEERRRRKRLNFRFALITILANLVGATLAVIFFSLGISYEETSVNPGEAFTNTGLFIVPLMVLGSLVGGFLTRHLDNWYLHPEKSLPLTPHIQQPALNNSLISALISFAMWFVAGLANTLTLSGNGLSLMLYSFIGLAGIAGPMTALLIYFAVERCWSSEIPLFFPDGQPHKCQAFRFSMRRRLFVPSLVGLVLMAVMSVNLFTYLHNFPFLSPEAQLADLQGAFYRQLFLLGIATLVAVALTLTLGRYMINAVEALRQGMMDVRQGKLEQLPVTSSDEFGELTGGFNAMVNGLQQEEIVRRLFKLYVTPEVAEHAITHGAELGGRLAEATVLFADIRGFTALAERMAPDALITMLNRYFETLSSVVLSEGGAVNKFGGDSLLAVFGTPLQPLEDPAGAATRAARRMMLALADFNLQQQARGEPQLRCGIGIATGKVIVGNVGSRARMEYTVIGDAVNLASRLEAMTKTLGASVLLDETTARAARGQKPLVPQGEVEVRGKAQPVRIYALLIDEGPAHSSGAVKRAA